MQQKNRQTLESLSWFCHLCGMFSVFIGLAVTLMNLMNKNFSNMQTSLYILATGYALVKISAKLSDILNSERIDL